MDRNRKDDVDVVYAPLPSGPGNRENVIVLLPRYELTPPLHHRLRRCFNSHAAALIVLLLVCSSIYMLYPSKPAVRVVRLELDHFRVKTSPQLLLYFSFSLTLRVQNWDFFSFSYEDLDVSVWYRGRQLGFLTSDGGKVRARSSSYVNATLNVDGFEVIHDALYLIGDLAKGVIPLDTVTEVKGTLGLFFFNIPLEGRVSCEVHVNVNNQTIVEQDCTPV